MLKAEGILTTERLSFNVSEVLEIAEQIKFNAARFYYNAAELFTNLNVRNILIQLTAWEARYKNVFAGMRKELDEEGQEIKAGQLEHKALPDVRVMAGLTVFANRADQYKDLTGRESEREMIRKAIQNEEDIVLFFNGLRDEFTQDESSRKGIDDIIQEEGSIIDIFKHLR
ncbi:MAG: hypothetical protein ACYSR8_01545 [Planctomycetota bacterium]|jgi:rubrerythrin